MKGSALIIIEEEIRKLPIDILLSSYTTIVLMRTIVTQGSKSEILGGIGSATVTNETVNQSQVGIYQLRLIYTLIISKILIQELDLE